jgi:hypothetical protein
MITYISCCASSTCRRRGPAQRLLGDLELNPMPFKKAQSMEGLLADSLRKRGYVVFG